MKPVVFIRFAKGMAAGFAERMEDQKTEVETLKTSWVRPE